MKGGDEDGALEADRLHFAFPSNDLNAHKGTNERATGSRSNDLNNPVWADRRGLSASLPPW